MMCVLITATITGGTLIGGFWLVVNMFAKMDAEMRGNRK